jgi:phospholipid/cholesterol/gamma-HCH transport system permease protein
MHVVTSAGPSQSSARLDIRHAGTDVLVVELAGDWRAELGPPDERLLLEVLEREPALRRVAFETSGLTAWSSGLIVFFLQCQELCRTLNRVFDRESLPAGAQRLMELAAVGPANPPSLTVEPTFNLVEKAGVAGLRLAKAARANVTFLGESTLALGRWMRGRSKFRQQDALWLTQQCGVDALPIVALIACLVGLILAFVGSVQLVRFGASIYVADLVAIALVREMGCMMTAIIMCGRTGAAFAAQLGTMKVNQELDAFTVFGIPPIDFLVLPRVLALLVMMPLLTVFANLVGIAGGFAVAMLMLDLSVEEYWQETVLALSLAQFSIGLIKSVAFGLIVGLTGCMRGMQCGTDAASVGQATTSAVVTGITWIIVADAVFAVIFNVLGI